MSLSILAVFLFLQACYGSFAGLPLYTPLCCCWLCCDGRVRTKFCLVWRFPVLFFRVSSLGIPMWYQGGFAIEGLPQMTGLRQNSDAHLKAALIQPFWEIHRRGVTILNEEIRLFSSQKPVSNLPQITALGPPLKLIKNSTNLGVTRSNVMMLI